MFKCNLSFVCFLLVFLSTLVLSNNTFAVDNNIKNTAQRISANKVDPTRPFTGNKSLNSIAKKSTKLVLQSIIEQGSQRRAIINGKILKRDEHIGGYQVMKINSKSVTLKSVERSLTLSLFTKVLSK